MAEATPNALDRPTSAPQESPTDQPETFDSLRSATTEETDTGSMDIPGEFAKLAKHQKASAALNFTASTELADLPSNYRIITITVKAADFETLEEVLNGADTILNLGSNTVRNSDDEVITIQALLQDPSDAARLLNELSQIPIDIGIVKDPGTTKAQKIGNTISAIHPTLHSNTPGTTAELDGSKIRLILADGEEQQYTTENKSIRYLGGLTPGKNWKLLHTTTQAVKLAQKQRPDVHEQITGLCSIIAIDINSLLDGTQEGAEHFQTAIEQIARVAEAELAGEDGEKSNTYFHPSFDNKGQLVLCAFGDRSEGYMNLLAQAIHRATDGKASIHLSKGNIQKDNKPGIATEGYTNKQIEEKISCDQAFYNESTTGRGVSTAKITATEVKNQQGTYIIESARSETTLRVAGGPRKLIGLKAQLAALRKYTQTDNPARFIKVSGQSGLGKSTFVAELLKEYPGALSLSIDAAGEGKSGQALVTIANQIYAVLTDPDRFDLNPHLEKSQNLQDLKDFCEGTPSSQIDIAKDRSHQATGKMHGIVVLCLTAIKFIKRYQKIPGITYTVSTPLLLAIDDLQHTDALTDEDAMTLLYQITKQFPKSKILGIERHDERFRSNAQGELEMRLNEEFSKKGLFSKPAVVEVPLQKPDGRPVQDYKNPTIMKEYILWIFEESDHQLIGGIEEGVKFTDDWHETMAEKFETALEINKCMAMLKKANAFILTAGSREIGITDEGKELIRSYADQTIEVRDANQIKKLSPNAKATLQCLALLGSSMPMEQIKNIAKRINQGETEEQEVVDPLKELEQALCIIKDHSRSGLLSAQYKIVHDSFRKSVIKLMGHKEARAIATMLRLELSESPLEPDNAAMFNLASYCIDSKAPEFWQDYQERGSQMLAEAISTESTQNTYDTAKRISIALAKRPDDNAMFAEPLIENLVKLRVAANLALAEAALEIGKLEEAAGAAALIEEEFKKSPQYLVEDSAQLTKAQLAGFQTASLAEDTNKMIAYLNKLSTGEKISPERELLLNIKLHYKIALKSRNTDNYNICLGMYTKNQKTIENLKNSKDPESKKMHMELERMEKRVQFEKVRAMIQLGGIDEDVMMDGQAIGRVFNPDKLLAILQSAGLRIDSFKTTPGLRKSIVTGKMDEASITEFKNLNHINQYTALEAAHFEDAVENQTLFFRTLKTDLEAMVTEVKAQPQLMHKAELVYLLELLGQVQSYLGETDKAAATFSDAGVVALKGGNHSEVLLLAKKLGDLRAAQAVAKITSAKDEEFSEAPGSASPRSVILRNATKAATGAYLTRGMAGAEMIDPGHFNQIIIRTQAIRSIGLELRSFENDLTEAKNRKEIEGDFFTLEGLKDYLCPLISKAQALFKEIAATTHWQTAVLRNDGEMAYYILSYLGDAYHFLAELELTDLELKKFKVKALALNDDNISAAHIEAGLKASEDFYDHTNEVQRKAEGLERLKRLLEGTKSRETPAI